jgi:hypothetical protein
MDILSKFDSAEVEAIKYWVRQRLQSGDEDAEFESVSTDDATVTGPMSVPGVTKTISNGSIDASDATTIKVESEDGSPDDLTQITGGSDKQIIILHVSTTATITARHDQAAVNELRLDGMSDKTLNAGVDRLMLQYNANFPDDGVWTQIAFSSNG